jgi:hypothetical protein
VRRPIPSKARGEDETLPESEKLRELERRLWQAADQLRANSKLRAADYSIPVHASQLDARGSVV